MTKLEKAAVLALVLAIVILVLLNIGPELKIWLKMWKLQRCYDSCAASHEIGTQEHRVCTDTCLAKYHMDGGK